MSKWINASKEERLVMLREVASRKQIVNNAVEKDWWVTMTLKALFRLPCAPYLLFKGGTSLSKGWDVIHRFSEDIDLTLYRQFFADVRHRSYAACENNQQVKLLRKDSRDYIIGELCPMLEAVLKQMGVTDFRLEPVVETKQADGTIRPIDHDCDPTALLLHYPSVLSTQLAYVAPTVKIEISCLSMNEPYEQRPISSLLYEAFPEEDDELSLTIPTVLPSRTFLEKTFLLNEEFQRRAPRSIRMSRHLYDIEKLMGTHWGEDALRDRALYEKIVEHRRKFYHVGGVDYDKDYPQEIRFVPQGDLAERYRADYDDMLHTYIYDKASALTYEELIGRLETLEELFHKENRSE